MFPFIFISCYVLTAYPAITLTVGLRIAPGQQPFYCTQCYQQLPLC